MKISKKQLDMIISEEIEKMLVQERVASDDPSFSKGAGIRSGFTASGLAAGERAVGLYGSTAPPALKNLKGQKRNVKHQIAKKN